MNIAVVYTAVTHGPVTENYCARFVASYHEYPPGLPHQTIVCCNGGALPTSTKLLFASMSAEFFPRTNDQGFDLSGYMAAAAGPAKDADAILCLGESVYFHRSGWLDRLVEAWTRRGPGLYGPFASNLVRTHLNTTAFLCAPKMLLDYPPSLWGNGKDRYGFEHGPKAFWRWMQGRGQPVRLVTWDGDYEPRAWRSPRNILWRGDQSNCLLWCNHTERWSQANYSLQRQWSRGADSPFK